MALDGERHRVRLLPSWPRSMPGFLMLWWKGRNVYAVLTGVLIASIAIFFLSTLRHGHKWDGDFALYIMHARNIVERRPYAVTGYIFNPRNLIEPAAYPAGLPLLLVPLYWFSGLDLQQMKMVGVGAFVLLLVFVVRVARPALPPAIALGFTAVVGLHPFVWDFKDTIFSELPFMLFCYAALYFVDGLQPALASSRWSAVAAAAIAAALASLTRTIGVMLLPITFLLTLCRWKTIMNPGTAASALAAAIMILASLSFPSDVGSYAGPSVRTFAGALKHYGGGLVLVKRSGVSNGFAVVSLLFDNLVFHGAARWLARGSVVAFLLLVAAGLIARARARFSAFELFFVVYALFFVIYPLNAEPSRYLLPLWPLFLLYGFCGAYAVGGLLGRAAQVRIPALLLGAFCALYVLQYARADVGPIPHSVTDPPSRELFTAIEANVPPDEAVLVWRPTIIALFTRRRAAVWPARFSDDELWRYMGEIRAQYIVEKLVEFGEGPDPEQDMLHGFILRNRAALDLVFSNSWFNLYRVAASTTTQSCDNGSLGVRTRDCGARGIRPGRAESAPARRP